MLMPNRHYPHLSYEVITGVAQLIDSHLRDAWVITVEYTDEIKYINTRWKQWGKQYFINYDSTEVVDNIFSCHVNNRLCSIRIHAEKFNPECSLYYSICQACSVPKELRDSSI